MLDDYFESTAPWTVDVRKADADDCIKRILGGPALDYPVTWISGSGALTEPFIQCGAAKQVSLRADEGEMFTLYPPHGNSYEGQWCAGVVSAGTTPPSLHQLTIAPL